MEWFKTLAPLLGTALGGPLGGAAASFLADKLGIQAATVEAVTEVLNSGKMTPEQIESVKLAEINFKTFIETNKIDLEKIAAADRDSARTMQVATRSNMPAILTCAVTVGYFVVLGLLMKMPEIKSDALLIMLGNLGGAWLACVAFWVGTTNSSGRKDQIIANQAAK